MNAPCSSAAIPRAFIDESDEVEPVVVTAKLTHRRLIPKSLPVTITRRVDNRPVGPCGLPPPLPLGETILK